MTNWVFICLTSVNKKIGDLFCWFYLFLFTWDRISLIKTSTVKIPKSTPASEISSLINAALHKCYAWCGPIKVSLCFCAIENTFSKFSSKYYFLIHFLLLIYFSISFVRRSGLRWIFATTDWRQAWFQLIKVI